MGTDGDVSIVEAPAQVEAAAALAWRGHAGLRARLPFLPARAPADFASRIGWMTRNGVVAGLHAGGELAAFLGAFPIDDFRNAGRGSFGPDWCHGFAERTDAATACRRLYRCLAARLLELGCPIHAFAFYASEPTAMAAMGLTGFGHLVMDAARPAADLLAVLPPGRGPAQLCRGTPDDAAALAALDAQLAAHIGAAPVLGSRPRGRDACQWREWLAGPGRVAVLARRDGRVVGFIKAELPQFDVSYAVHAESTLAINGMYVDADSRRWGLGTALLAHLVGLAAAAGKTVISVDCETTNLEAYGFWSRWFWPVSWSLERRV